MSEPISRAVAIASRSLAGAAAATPVVVALASPLMPAAAKAASIAVAVVTLLMPGAGLALAVALAPAGLLLAASPARAAEMLAWSFLAAWLLALWRPLGRAPSGAPALSPAHLPALLFGTCAAASWLAYVIGSAAGTDPLMLPALAARAIPLDHLVLSSSEAETFTLLPLLAGLALFAAAAVLAPADERARRAIAVAIALSTTVLALATLADVQRQWAVYDYEAWFVLRYVRGERFTLHLKDLNAAGSHYMLGVLILAALAVRDRARRALWIALAVPIVPALWLSGSRSAVVGGIIAGACVILLARRIQLPAFLRLRPAYWVAVGLVAAALVAGGTALASGEPQQGSAVNALRLRAHFLLTSARMFASRPVLGVGIGHYHERSNQFMTPLLQRIYGNENAHNYFTQQFAELGIVGGLLFAWLTIGGLAWAWRDVRATQGGNVWSLSLLAATSGYLLTCLTGHPLLVPEAAMPFWAALGAVAGSATWHRAPDGATRRATLPRWAVAVTLIVAAANVAAAARRYALAAQPPMESGFYELRRTADGTPYVWMTRHGVFYIGRQAGTIAIPLRATSDPRGEGRFHVSVEIAGRSAGVYDVGADDWTIVNIPLRNGTALPFRRIDLRADRSWLPLWDGLPIDQPRSVMVGETRWTPAGGR